MNYNKQINKKPIIKVNDKTMDGGFNNTFKRVGFDSVYNKGIRPTNEVYLNLPKSNFINI